MIGLVSYIVFFLILSLIFGVAVLGLNLQWGFTGTLQCRCRGVHRDRRVHDGNPDRPGPGRGLRRIRTSLCRRADWRDGSFWHRVPWLSASPRLKLRHEYLAVATFGIAVTIQLVCLNWEYLTGGTLGLIGIPNPSKAWADGPLAQNALYLLVVLVVVGLTFAALERIVKSPWGRMLKAIREDDVAAASLGKSPERVRLEAFVLGCMIMGLSGALYVSFIGYVSPWDFLPILTFQIWTMLIVGGSANNRGALLGALIVWGVWTMSGFVISRVVPSEIQAQGGAMQAVLIGLILVVTLLIRPRGLIGEELHVSRHARS